MTPLWTPAAERVEGSQMTAFMSFVRDKFQLSFTSYEELHSWSIEDSDAFWEAVWQFCEIKTSRPYSAVSRHLQNFPGTTWFPDCRLNFAENLLRFNDDHPAIVGVLEDGTRTTYTYAELRHAVAALASAMRRQGITTGDRVAALMPNTADTVIAMLATTSLGAIWSSCSPDFGATGAIDRFGQIEPKLLFATRSYCYDSRRIDCLSKIREISERLSSLEQTVIFDDLSDPGQPNELSTQMAPEIDSGQIIPIARYTSGETAPLEFESLPFDHPLYIMYSSGTTGAPKCIVHGAGGTLLQHLKEHKLHTNLARVDTLFYFTTCGWMMWNWLVSGLATGCTLVLYDGSPFAHNGTVLLDAIDHEQITVFGTSAKYLSGLEKQSIKPRETHSLSSLQTILSTGSTLSEVSYEYVYRDFKKDVCLSSISGGTDILSCFMLGNPNLPVYSGEIQCLGLGMAVEFWDEDESCKPGVTGELVCTKPFPSTPLGFWRDNEDKRFHAAYFERNPNVWTHGDFGCITARGGVMMQGRSDAVLNPAGVRIGTAEIYRQVETLGEVIDCIAVGQTWDDDERVLLFVVLKEGVSLDAALEERIKLQIRVNTTPRHVPARVLQVADIPRTRSGKIVELAVRNVIHNKPVTNTDALANPDALEFFRNHPGLS